MIKRTIQAWTNNRNPMIDATARVYAAALIASNTTDEAIRRRHARAAVTDYLTHIGETE